MADFTKIGYLTQDHDNEWDIIVVGSGHNGLTAAAYLAKAGKRVLVLERQYYAGGGVASLEMAEPGFKSERHSAIHSLIQGNPLILNDELDLLSHFGLQYRELHPTYAIIFENGALVLYRDREKTMAEIRKIAPEEAANYDRLMSVSVGIVDLLMPSMYEPPADMTAAIAASPYAAEIQAAAASSPMDIVQKYFKDETITVALLRYITEIQLAHPTTKGTGLLAYVALGALEKFGQWVPEGGGTAFTNSVIKCIEAHGGEVRLNTEVTRIITENGRAVGVGTRRGQLRAKDGVVAQIHPHNLGHMVKGLDAQIISDAEKTKISEFTLFVIHAALERPLDFNAGGAANYTIMNTVCPNSLEELITSYDTMARGELPENIMIGASTISLGDPTRAPAGKALLHAVVMVRPRLPGKEFEAWEEVKEDYVQRIFHYLTRFVKNLTPELVRSYVVVTPADHMNDSPSFRMGDICGISMGGDQLGLNRPTPALAQYRVPGLAGLYLCGPFMHPGGGVWGGGRPVARRVMEDLGLDFDAEFVKKSSRL
ncbi:hypothetical protein JX265_013524 [Neoarthrinium moseri]|uniref:Pyridine nucleotide-disulfide oxidoreductase domain-containing protein 2 n=1 Tax=Neoarthrinium moseri TaxID=1658444 RepID=A0A9P9W8D9_9PEZI|nr:uncharacterized protein JN550_013305 [Neoarthrinium moseri]KAI1849877.1 hypothetical protein JX265_013524 [Neoarthrinium moseri]KAI1857325.1 hypothetical protein JN550_013305 [Neoarthrinium moseri]